MPRTEHPWPAHTTTTLPWRSAVRGPRPDRETASISASVPPRIADAQWTPDADTAALLDRAATAVRDLDEHHGTGLTVLGGVLDRTEAVASSRIEDESATLDDFARAAVGIRANSSATAMVRAGGAIDGLVAAASSGTITEDALLAAHRRLMRDDPVDGRYAGRWRDVQNWIGGGPTPRLARHVPPPPELVPDLMDDLFTFLHRRDLHPIAQAAIAHAQFESIHPFTDGNGRIGRALVAAVLRRRGLARVVTVPVAAALVAERDRYFWHLERYRRGAVDEWIRDLAIAIGTVCDEATLTALLLDEVAADRAAGACSRGPHAVVGRALVDDPVLTEERLELLLDGDEQAIDVVTDDLCQAGVLRPVTERRRRRAWSTVAAADEIAAFGARVHAAVTQRANRVGW
ncbi:Fic family protein [Curtobacterium pusillum]|uniref:Fic family protein n=1 Tax=Curtobacterium pusillum TaxID=69373 RepID=A0ABX2M860_9MICO|nr:Fic family protein [Curtobacterium pusillum]NUU13653.1 Fic family protein [Curtobacterium pusillum]GLK30763.1 Fic family protein [Curtobacterium pusillum]